MSRPAGCAFLGASATATTGYLVEPELNPTSIIADSGSDITLISSALLARMKKAPKLHSGQRINLVQVTGTSSISGFVNIPIFFKTEEGLVELHVEAYVVKGMSTPFILGNDFADQYAISIIRKDGSSYLEFGNSGRKIKVENSTSPSLQDSNGHVFSVRTIPNLPSITAKFKAHRRMKKARSLQLARASDNAVRSALRTTIPGESSTYLPVSLNFPKGSDIAYIEKYIRFKGEERIFGAPDSLISRSKPMLHVANFSKEPLTIPAGEVLGRARNPNSWLDSDEDSSSEHSSTLHAHANLIQALADHLLNPTQNTMDEPDLPGEVQGGPKTAEISVDDTSEDELVDSIGYSPELTEEQRDKLKQIVRKNMLAFGFGDRLGHYPAKVRVPVKPGTKEVSLPPFPNMSPAKREAIDTQMDKWMKLGVIEPSRSPWGAPAFIVYRNGKPRMVVDFRKLNESVIKDEFPLPRQDEILQTLTGSQWLSTLDALAGFTQLEIHEDDKERLAFRTHRGLFQFRRMPFGYTNGPAIFQRIMQGILAPFLWIFALVYIDDMVIFSKTFEDHCSHLDQVFTAIRNSGITLSPSKCFLGFQSLMLLGQRVSRLGLSTDKLKVDAIIELDQPKNVSELQTFLGMMVYFSAYIPYYAWIVAPLFKLLKKGSTWDWGDSQQKAFESAKTALVNAPVRAYAIVGNGYRLYSDACDFGIACILQQLQLIKLRDLKGTKIYEKAKLAFENKQPVPKFTVQVSKAINDTKEPGVWAKDFDDTEVELERVIAYWSRTLKSAERNYSPTEREALALKDGLVKFQPYIEGERIIAVTDHAALTWTRTFQNINRRLLNWGTTFAAYPNMHIVHRAGRVHSNVDPISRLRRLTPEQHGPLPTDPSSPALLLHGIDGPPNSDPQEETFSSSFLIQKEHDSLLDCEYCLGRRSFTKVSSTSRACHVMINLDPEFRRSFLNGYSQDPHFRVVLEDFRSGSAGGHWPQYVLGDDGLLYFEDWAGASRLCVPQCCRTDLMSKIHNTISEAAHSGYHRTYNRIAETYYWPRMSRDIKRFVYSCDICQKVKPRRHGPIGLLQPIPIPSRPFEVISMDFITELPVSAGFDSILVIVDKLTKFATFVPVTSTITQRGTAELLVQHIFSKYGLPRQIISDRDSRWRNDFWRDVCELLGTTRALTTAYHPQADGQTEIMNQILEIALRAYISPNLDNWSDALAPFALSYNTSIHTSTGFSPSFLLYGFNPRTVQTSHHDDSSAVSRTLEASHAHSDALALTQEFSTYRSQAQDALKLSHTYQQRAYDKNHAPKEFHEGDLVLLNPHTLSLFRDFQGRGRKLLPVLDGPFEILRKISPVAYQLRLPSTYGIHPVINIAHLESYEPSPAEFGSRPTITTPRSSLKAEEEYEVDAILDEKWVKAGKRRKRLFLTSFIGYGPEANEWLDNSQLKNAPAVLKAWRLRPSAALDSA